MSDYLERSQHSGSDNAYVSSFFCQLKSFYLSHIISDLLYVPDDKYRLRQYAGEQTTRWKLLIFCM